MTTSEERWWRRSGSPEKGFRYLKVDGKPLRSKAALGRIERLAIPPAWSNVDVSPDAGRKIQARGEDAEGRRQYIYSDDHVRGRDRRKWRRVRLLGRALPELRSRLSRDLGRFDFDRDTGPGRDPVLALVVRFIEQGFFRVGNERYATANGTRGIATLEKRQVEVGDGMLVFTYRGKQKKELRTVVVDDAAIAFVEALCGLPGKRLFQYRDADGTLHPVRAPEVNRYLKEAAGRRFTSKDLRTFGATVRAATVLADLEPPDSDEEAERNVLLCCRLVAQELGNTREVCREAYIHPAVLDEYLASGRTIEVSGPPRPIRVSAGASDALTAEEDALLRFLGKHG